MEDFETKITVRYAETDQMGIVHHSVYAVWYEVARIDFCKAAGLPYKEMEKASQAELPLNTMPPGMQASGGLRVYSGLYSS